MAYIKILLSFLIGIEIGMGGMMVHMVKADDSSSSVLSAYAETPSTATAPAREPSPSSTLNPEPDYFAYLETSTPTTSIKPTTLPTIRPANIVTVMVTTVSTAILSPTAAPQVISANSSNITLNEQATVDAINQRRKDAGLGILSVNDQLIAAARRESNDNARHSRCDHTGTDGSSPWSRGKDAGFNGQMHGETITCGVNTPGEIVEWWWNSPSHKEILTKPEVKQIGLGWSDTTPVYATAVVAF